MVCKRRIFRIYTEMNKKINVLSFTKKGSQKNKELCSYLTEQEYDCIGYTIKRFSVECDLEPMPEYLSLWIGKKWGKEDFIFIGAIGIAVRLIAPWAKDKYSDSAVLVMDEKAQYCIPVLSGHVGGGIELAHMIENCMGAMPVITTATDVQKKFAVDVFAKKNRLQIIDRKLAKEISAAVLEEKKIGFYSELGYKGKVPKEVVCCESERELDKFEYGIIVTAQKKEENQKSNRLYLLAKTYVIGLGCRKNISYIKLEKGLQLALAQVQIDLAEILAFASIDLKKEEPAIKKLSENYQIPFLTYSAEKLKKVECVSSSSEFVASVTGVDNVCERAAKYCCPDGRMILDKLKLDGMTVAIVQKKMEVLF